VAHDGDIFMIVTPIIPDADPCALSRQHALQIPLMAIAD
jgi:hypothetical protein